MSWGFGLFLLITYMCVVAFGLVAVSYLALWGVLELALMITMVYYYNQGSRMSGVFYYYILQSISTLMMLVGAMLNSGGVLFSGFGLKVGLFPFFMWVVVVVWGSNLGIEVLLLLFMQKLIPFVLVVRWGWVLEGYSSLVAGMVSGGLISGSLLMSFGCSLKWVLAFSSLVHSSWLVVIMMANPGALIYYYLVYGLMMVLVLLALGGGEKKISVILLLVMSSIPPLMGFIVKFYALGLSGYMFLLVMSLGVLVSIMAVWGYLMNFVYASMVVSSHPYLNFSNPKSYYVSMWLYFLVLGVSVI